MWARPDGGYAQSEALKVGCVYYCCCGDQERGSCVPAGTSAVPRGGPDLQSPHLMQGRVEAQVRMRLAQGPRWVVFLVLGLLRVGDAPGVEQRAVRVSWVL